MKLLVPENLIEDLNRRFEGEHPREVLRWALTDSGLDRLAIASSFQADDVAVTHMAVQFRPDVDVLFLETGFHFDETIEYRDRITELLGLNLRVLRGDYTPETMAVKFGDRMYEWDPNECSRLNKVVPLKRHLMEYDGWITGMRRDSAPTRANSPIVEQYEHHPEPDDPPASKTLVKFNPIAAWKRKDVWDYMKEHDLPQHPLYAVGYGQISCAPCTRMLFPGEDERAGRWAGVEGKVECGIHETETAKQEEVLGSKT